MLNSFLPLSGVVAFLILFAVSCNPSDQPRDTTDIETSLQEKRTMLVQKLAEFDQAFAAADTVKLGTLISKDYTHTNGSSKPIGRKAWLSYMATRSLALHSGTLKVLEYNISNRKITYLDNAAIINLRVDVLQVSDGEQKQNAYQVTQVWREDSGVWKRVAFHDGKINK